MNFPQIGRVTLLIWPQSRKSCIAGYRSDRGERRGSGVGSDRKHQKSGERACHKGENQELRPK